MNTETLFSKCHEHLSGCYNYAFSPTVEELKVHENS